jgi:hypothetical protein
MTLFASESEMQEWLSSALEGTDGLAELIVNLDALDGEVPSNFAESRILQSFKVCVSSLYITETFSENENISLSDGEALKPDFVLYAPEKESIIIVELKNISGPTRQAGTELSAYSCEVRTTIPFLSDGDIVHVLISTEWPTLLKHFVRHEIFWQSRNLLCLQPVKNDKGEIGLRILALSELSEDVASFKIGQEYLGGYQICLYDGELYSKNPNRERLDQYIEQFKSALNSMAIMGNRLNSHGFAFLWKDLWTQSLAPYSITVLNFAPFQSVERFLHIGNDDLPDMVQRFIKLIQEHDPEGHGNTLSEITDTCIDLLNQVCSPRAEGFTHWGKLREIMDERAEYIAFVGWGLFGDAHLEKLKTTYQEGNISCPSTSPELGFSVISDIIDDSYEFIHLSYVDLDYDDSAEEPDY